MNKDAVIFFLRYPERGKVRSRLAEEIGDDLAYELYIRFIRDILGAIRAVDAENIIVGTGSTGKGPPGFFGRSLRLVQRGHDPGERLYHAFADVFSRGYTRAVLIGSDCPGLTADYIREAFVELGNHDAVLGPRSDGGYCLIAFHKRSLRDEFFRGISWGTSRVLIETMGKIEDTMMELSILSQEAVVDGLDDLRRFYEDRVRSAPAFNTAQFIEQNREKLFGTL